MRLKVFPVIDPTATGNNIRRLRLERGLTVRDLQDYFGFEEPRAIYKWQRGETLPSVDNLYALGNLFEVPMEQILVPTTVKLHSFIEQQVEPCCSNHFMCLRFRRQCTVTYFSLHTSMGCFTYHAFGIEGVIIIGQPKPFQNSFFLAYKQNRLSRFIYIALFRHIHFPADF